MKRGFGNLDARGETIILTAQRREGRMGDLMIF